MPNQEESVSAANMAAEMLAKHDATIREQAAKLESLHQYLTGRHDR